MASQHGFQSNTTIQAAFWIYKPDPSIVPPPKEIMQEVNGIQRIETTADHKKVWLYYAMNNTSPSQEPYILEGEAAQLFMSDLEALFV